MRQHQILLRLRGGHEGAAVGPIHPAVEDQDGAVRRRGIAEIQIEVVQLGDIQVIAAEAIRIGAVAMQQARQHVAALVVARAHGVNAPLHAEQAELGEGRRFELVVGEDLDRGRMVDRDELHLVEIGNLAQLFGDADFIAPIHGLQRLAGNLHVFVVIDGEVTAIARGCAQRRHSKHIRDEAELTAIPGEDYGAGAGEALRFLILDGFVDGLLRLVLDQAVGPGDAHGVGDFVGIHAEQKRDAAVDALLITGAGLDLDLRAGRQLHILDAIEARQQPVVMGLGGVLQQVQGAIARDQRHVGAAIAIEIGLDGSHRGGDFGGRLFETVQAQVAENTVDRKSTRLNSSHLGTSYAVFCLKKKQYLRLDLTLYPGRSRGAVVDTAGRVLGIATSARSGMAGLAVPACTVCLFFLMMRRPPKSTLFPYTPLFRSVTARTFTRPLEELVDGVRALGKGDFRYPVEARGASEIAELTNAFSLMRESLHQAQQRLLNAERLATIGRMASSISHDLRHPLTAVLANAEFLADADLTRQQREELYQEIRVAVNRLTDLVDSLLELSRPADSLNLSEAPIERTISRAIELVQAHPQFHKILVSIESPGLHSAQFDSRKMERVFYNLLLNGCQAAQVCGGHVAVHVAEVNGNLEIRTTDDGPGVESSLRDKLFQPFVSHGKENGTGLGLTIAQKIVQDHDGTLELESSVPGHTVMQIVLPRVCKKIVTWNGRTADASQPFTV